MLSIFLLVERLLNFRYIPNQRLFCGRFIFSIRFTKSFCFDEVGQGQGRLGIMYQSRLKSAAHINF